jgi:hypothetical protein
LKQSHRGAHAFRFEKRPKGVMAGQVEPMNHLVHGVGQRAWARKENVEGGRKRRTFTCVAVHTYFPSGSGALAFQDEVGIKTRDSETE